MKEGNLVKFVGVANTYKRRIGVVCRLYNRHGLRKNHQLAPPNSALVYFAGLENEGRCRPLHKSDLHPMCLTELEPIVQ